MVLFFHYIASDSDGQLFSLGKKFHASHALIIDREFTGVKKNNGPAGHPALLAH
jgi:hypothetical protein